MTRLLLVLAMLMSGPSFALAQDGDKPAPEAEKTAAVEPAPIDVIEDTMPVIRFPDPPQLELDGELQFWLSQKKQAPYDGVLLNPEAVSLVLSEYRAQKARGEAALEKQRAVDFAVLQLQTGELRVELAAVKTKSDIRQQADAAENERLHSLNQDLIDSKSDFWGDFAKIGGSALVGAGLVAILILVSGGER